MRNITITIGWTKHNPTTFGPPREARACVWLSAASGATPANLPGAEKYVARMHRDGITDAQVFVTETNDPLRETRDIIRASWG